MKNIFKKIASKNITLLAGSTALVQGITVLLSPLLTRLYAPEHFGQLAIYISVLSFLLVAASLRYQLAIPLPKLDQAAKSLAYLSFLILIGEALLLGLILILFRNKLLTISVLSHLQQQNLWLLLVSFIGGGTYQILNYWALRYSSFSILASTKVQQGLSQVFVQILYGLFDKNALGLFLADAVGRTSGSGKLLSEALKKYNFFRSPPPLSHLAFAAKRYWKFPVFSSISGLMNNAGLQAPSLLVAALYGSETLGYFSLSQRVVGLPLSFIGVALSQIYFSEASSLLKENNMEALRKKFIEVAKNLFAIGIIPILIVSIFAPKMCGFLFGDVWLEAGNYIQILGPMFLLQLIVVPLSQTLNILEQQQTQLFWDFGRLFLVLLGFYLSWLLDLSAFDGIKIYAFLMASAYGILFALSYGALKTQKPKKI